MNLILPSDDPPLVQQGLPPPNLNRSTKIRINGTTIEIDPENTKPVKQLGHGAYGFVELIEHEPSGIQLAVKVGFVLICFWKLSHQFFCNNSGYVHQKYPIKIVYFVIWIYWLNHRAVHI